MQRYIPQKGITPFTLRTVLTFKSDLSSLFTFYGLTTNIRIDGKSDFDSELWIKLTDLDDELKLTNGNSQPLVSNIIVNNTI